MLTAHVSVLEGLGWDLEQGQRVRVHLGTAEVLARTAILGQDRFQGGDGGWVQLRLEDPVLARVGDRLVLRSYSPITTLGGGEVAEVLPPKRRRLTSAEEGVLARRLDAAPEVKVLSLLETVRWAGVNSEALPQRTGLPSGELDGLTEALVSQRRCRVADRRLFASTVWEEGSTIILSTIEAFHRREPLRPGHSLEELRQVLPGPRGPKLAEVLLQSLSDRDLIEIRRGFVSLAGFQPSLSPHQTALQKTLRDTLQDAGLSPPTLRELTAAVGPDEDVEGLLRHMEEVGEVVAVDGQLFFWGEAIYQAGRAVVDAFGGRSGLGPSDFRDVLPLTRKHLLPLLRYFDTVGITTRLDEERSVVDSPPRDWGTSGPAGK
jgi:selenocysteine-specific elongation factor